MFEFSFETIIKSTKKLITNIIIYITCYVGPLKLPILPDWQICKFYTKGYYFTHYNNIGEYLFNNTKTTYSLY